MVNSHLEWKSLDSCLCNEDIKTIVNNPRNTVVLNKDNLWCLCVFDTLEKEMYKFIVYTPEAVRQSDGLYTIKMRPYSPKVQYLPSQS